MSDEKKGNLHVIHGGANEQAPGSVEHALQKARELISSETHSVVIVIALQKNYPPPHGTPLNGTLIWSACDSLRLFGLMNWINIKLYEMLGRG
jgi:hypothetical protein